MEGLDDRAKALPGYALIERLKSEPLTAELITEVEFEVQAAREWAYRVHGDKKLRVNEGLGWSALRSVWAQDAYKLMSEISSKSETCPASGLTNAECQASICDCFPGEDDRFGLHPEYFSVRKPKNNPTGIKAPTMATHGRKK